MGVASGARDRLRTFIPLSKYNNAPILLLQAGGILGKYVEGLTDESAKREIHNALVDAFGNSTPQAEAFVRSNWQRDPFSLGARTALAPGSSTQTPETSAAPIAKKIFFAGDHCLSSQIGTPEAAFLSGIIAAKKIAAELDVTHSSLSFL